MKTNEIIDAKLRALIDQARRSRFYAERLRSLTIESVKDLPKIPPLTRKELDDNVPPRGDGLATVRYTGGYVTRSGGSTGKPKFSIHDAHDWDEMIAHGVGVFRTAGIEPTDRIANCMICGDLYGSFVSFDHINCRLGATTFALADKAEPEILAQLWRDFGVDVLEGVPALMIPLLKAAKQREPAFRLRKVLFGGEPLRHADREWLRSALGVERIASLIGSNETGQLAIQCPEMTGSLHHAVDDFNFIEIVDQDARPVPDGEPGHVLVTALTKYAFPLIRYEIGDSSRIVPGECACGRPGRRLEYLGRSDDSVCLAVLNFHYRDVEAALDGIPYSALQVVARNMAEHDALTIRIETGSPEPSLAGCVRERLLAKMPKVRERLDSGALGELAIETLPVGSLRRNPRSGKIRPVCDERELAQPLNFPNLRS